MQSQTLKEEYICIYYYIIRHLTDNDLKQSERMLMCNDSLVPIDKIHFHMSQILSNFLCWHTIICYLEYQLF